MNPLLFVRRHRTYNLTYNLLASYHNAIEPFGDVCNVSWGRLEGRERPADTQGAIRDHPADL
jgi:hypothetical protein